MIVIFFYLLLFCFASASVADANKKDKTLCQNCSEQPQIYTCGSLSVSLAELKSFFSVGNYHFVNFHSIQKLYFLSPESEMIKHEQH